MFLLSPLGPFARSKIPLGVHQETHQESHKQIFNGKAETIFLSNEEKHRSKPPSPPFPRLSTGARGSHSQWE